MADILESNGGFIGFIFTPQVTFITSTIVLLASGLFVSFFVGDAIIMSGLRKEKKFVDKAQEEMEREEKDMRRMEHVLEKIETEIEHLHTGHTHEPQKKVERRTEDRSGGGFQPMG